MQEIINQLQEMQDYLDEPLTDDPYLVEQRGSILCVHLSRSGKIFADLQAEYKKALNEELIKVILPRMAKEAGASFTVQNLLAKSACYEMERLVTWSERIHKTTTRQLDWCRSVMSKNKEEMRMNQYGGGGVTHHQN
jgi:hypothetical protein